MDITPKETKANISALILGISKNIGLAMSK